jgi:drug/metabolite transporter (DMT)-like permease
VAWRAGGVALDGERRGNEYPGGIVFSEELLYTGESQMTLASQIVVALSSVSLFVFCDYIITRWVELIDSQGYWTWRLLCAILAAPLGAVAFGLVATRMGLAAVSAFINTGIVLGGVLVGIVVRGDQLTVWQKVGVALGVLAMVFLCLGKRESL